MTQLHVYMYMFTSLGCRQQGFRNSYRPYGFRRGAEHIYDQVNLMKLRFSRQEWTIQKKFTKHASCRPAVTQHIIHSVSGRKEMKH